MKDSLNVVPKAREVNTGVKEVGPVAEALADVLSDTYRLVFKTHAYHWNVEGPMFYSVHNLTEEQYEEMFTAADVIAERIRALGALAPVSFEAVRKRSVIEDRDETPSAGDICGDLADDHERIAHRLHALAELADSHKDIVTEDLAVARSTFHEKAAWMLRSLGTK